MKIWNPLKPVLNKMTVFTKCCLLITATTLIVASILAIQSEKIFNRAVEDGVRNLALEMTANVGHQIGGALRFGDTAGLTLALEKVIEASDGQALFALVQNKAGETLTSIGEMTKEDAEQLAVLASTTLATGAGEITGDGFYVAMPATAGASGETTVGAVAIIWSPAPAFAEVAQARMLSYAIAAIAFVILCGLSALALRALLSQPLQDVARVITEITDGSYDQEPIHLERGDEIGAIARNIENLKSQLTEAREVEAERVNGQENQKQVVVSLSEALQRMSEGDLTKTLDDPFASDYEALRENYNRTVSTMVGIIDSVVENSEKIRNSSEEINQSSSDLSQRTESQAATLEETAAALDQLTSSVKSAAEGAREVEGIVTDAQATAENSGAVVLEAVDAMSLIEKSSKQISQIITVIDDISFQTNLLALNAGVEAARAGEAGRGFAVVASEVRALAQRSSEAAQEIKQLISDSSQQVNHGVQLVDRTGEELRKIIDSVGTISTHVVSIASGAEEQSISLAEINTGVLQLDQVTQHNAAMVEESTAASQLLRNDANELACAVSIFNTGNNKTTSSGQVVNFDNATTPQPEANEVDFSAHDAGFAELEPRRASGWEDF